MADFNKCIKDTLTNEGYFNGKAGFVNDIDDAGGLTIAGIASKFHPTWEGFTRAKQLGYDAKKMTNDSILYNMITKFYKSEFWDKIGGDNIKPQNIASILMDAAVLEGIVPAIKRAQLIVGSQQTGKVNQELIDKLSVLQ